MNICILAAHRVSEQGHRTCVIYALRRIVPRDRHMSWGGGN
jgi:hypothetical protein